MVMNVTALMYLELEESICYAAAVDAEQVQRFITANTSTGKLLWTFTAVPQHTMHMYTYINYP